MQSEAKPMDRRQTAILQAQYKKATAEPHDYLRFMMDEKNISKWYVLLSGFDGDEDEFKGGEYLVRVELPSDFPFNPPHFYFMTPNGLYGTETKVCISIGEYHKADYRAALGVSGFCNQLVSGLIGWRDMGGGINILKTKINEKKAYAIQSADSNNNNYPELMTQLNDTFKSYSAKWDQSKMSEATKIKFGLAVPVVPGGPTTITTNNTSPKVDQV